MNIQNKKRGKKHERPTVTPIPQARPKKLNKKHLTNKKMYDIINT